MNQRMGWIALGLALGLGLVACSSKVLITAESTSAGASSAQGSSSGSPGGTGGGSSGSGSSGTGAVGSGKVVTADNDIGQYASFTIMPSDPSMSPQNQKVVDGPFFVTDVYGDCLVDVVMGGACSVQQSQRTTLLSTNGGGSGGWFNGQAHGMRLPVLAGQTLCLTATTGCTVLGFRPY